jgi:hypothetical protein
MRKKRERNNKTSLSIIILVFIFIGVTSMNVFGFFGFGGTEKWKEEVQLSDGRVIVIEREMLREGGGDEWVSNRSLSKPKEHRIQFKDPDGSGKIIEWRSTKKSPHIYPEIPLILDLESGQLVIFTTVGISPGCEVYNKYIYRNGVWSEEELPAKFEQRATNLFLKLGIDMPKFVDLETKRKVNANKGYRKAVRQVGPNREVCG